MGRGKSGGEGGVVVIRERWVNVCPTPTLARCLSSFMDRVVFSLLYTRLLEENHTSLFPVCVCAARIGRDRHVHIVVACRVGDASHKAVAKGVGQGRMCLASK